MNESIYVITSFYIGFNSRGERVKINEKMVWCSEKEEAIKFIQDPYNMEYFVRNYCRYVVIEEVQKLYGIVKAIGWWVAEYKEGNIYPKMVKLGKCPIDNYEEEEESIIKLVV
jgi:hypothetical protein